MKITLDTKTLTFVAAVLALVVPLVAAATNGPSNAANKTAATGSTVEFLSPLAPSPREGAEITVKFQNS